MLSSKDVSDMLGMKPVTVRKYCLALESAGYSVKRDANGNREFTELDVMVIREVQALQNKTGVSVQRCADVIAGRHNRPSENVAPAVIEQSETQYAERYGDVMEIMRSQQELIQRQADELERLHKRMDDQSANLTAILREVLETRRMVAAAQAKKKWQFWRKDNVFPDMNDPEIVWKMKHDGK